MTDEVQDAVSAENLRDLWPALSPDERVAGFRQLSPEEAPDFFLSRGPVGQTAILLGMPEEERGTWLHILPPDDVADILQQVSSEERADLLARIDEPVRVEVTALLAYAHDDAGGLMSPRFARVRPDITADVAIRYLRRLAQDRQQQIYYVYVLDDERRLLGVVSFRELLLAPGDRKVRALMRTEVVSVPDDMDQEAVARVIARHDFIAVPVVDRLGRMKGIVTHDDITDVVQEEATEDIQKLGGMQALDLPYLQSGFLVTLKKRAGWLAVLFVGEMLTASAMSHFQEEIERAIVLTVFLPLIISSGGNSGGQASTLVIRAMALGEVRLRDWWRVVRREFASGLMLGTFLALIGLLMVFVMQGLFHAYGENCGLIAACVSISIVGVVTWGTLNGALLPFVLRRLGFDPASASAPFVATLVDVFGLVIYFGVAAVLIGGRTL